MTVPWLLPMWPAVRLLRRTIGLLIKTKDIARRIAEPGGDFGRVRPERLDYLTSMRDDRVNRGGDAIHHDVEQEARLR